MVYVLTPLLLLTLAGLAAIRLGVKHSVRGYEDERGFHEGSEPILEMGSRLETSQDEEAYGAATLRLF